MPIELDPPMRGRVNPRLGRRHAALVCGAVGIAVACSGGRLTAAAPADRELKPNMQVEYLQEPPAVDRLGDVFAKGTLHARVRTNLFWWKWDDENTSSPGPTRDNHMLGLGGSLVFRTARLQGWSGVIGFYSSQPVLGENTRDSTPGVNFGKAGKDTYRTRADGGEAPLNVVAEAFAEYHAKPITVRIGRQMIDSLLLASNDTKMVPNAFEAARFELRPLPATRVGATIVRRQKLRDHSTFHSVLAYTKLQGNDDSGAHRGLTPGNLTASGRDPEPLLWLLTAQNRSIPNARLDAEFVGLAELMATAVAEASCDLKLAGSWTVTPAIRALRQWDRGAGAIGGAAISGAFARDEVLTTTAAKLASYRHPRRLDATLWAARLRLARGPWQGTLGTARVADEADVVAPWRGFPTGGYSRAMGQLDWLAATTSHMARLEYEFAPNRILSRLSAATAYERINVDDRKVRAGTLAITDRNVVTLEAIVSPAALPRTMFKLRAAVAGAEGNPRAAGKDYESYREVRFEMNHLF